MSDVSFDPDLIEYPSPILIGGERQSGSGNVYSVRRASDGRIVRDEKSAGPDQVDAAVSVARTSFKTSGWAQSNPRERQRVMRRWADLIDAHTEEIARLESAVSVRTISSVLWRDVSMAAELIRFYGEAIDKVEGAVLATPDTRLSLLVREPYGVVAAISPWNTPLLLATLKIAPAIAAGNAVVLKPSELTPYSIVRLAELGIEAGLPAGMLNVLSGLGPETGTALVRHPDVSYVSFTGSAATGARVMCDCAKHGLKPISLELGGKSPQLVFADAPDLDAVADLVAMVVCANAGQVCFAGTRLIVEGSVRDRVVDRIASWMDGVKPGATWQAETTLGPIANDVQANRLERLLTEARDAGAKVLHGGGRIEGYDGGHFHAPTLLGNLDNDNPAIREELFGPVLTVQSFETEEEGLALADHATFGLGAGVHTSDMSRGVRAARAIQAGTVWVNTFGPNPEPNAPMGGYKQSGFGKDFGLMGLEKYFKTKNIAIGVENG